MLKVADLTTVDWKEGTSQEAVEKIIVEGIGKMPGSKGKLSPEEVTAAAHYVRKLCGKTE